MLGTVLGISGEGEGVTRAVLRPHEDLCTGRLGDLLSRHIAVEL